LYFTHVGQHSRERGRERERERGRRRSRRRSRRQEEGLRLCAVLPYIYTETVKPGPRLHRLKKYTATQP